MNNYNLNALIFQKCSKNKKAVYICIKSFKIIKFKKMIFLFQWIKCYLIESIYKQYIKDFINLKF